MNISLTPKHEQFVAEKVQSGGYASADEVLREGLRLLEQEDERRRAITCLQKEIEKGFSGPFSPWTKKDGDHLRSLVAARKEPV
jgi:antitoxin ParD1/3/4